MNALRKIGGIRLAILAAVVLSAIVVLTKSQWEWLFEGDPVTTGAAAPALEGVDSSVERLFRITPDSGSSLAYRVQERLAGGEGVAEGATTVMAGDIAINTEDPSASRIGEVMINVEMFQSDSNLRDKRIRHDFLESTHFPFATFEATEIEGLPSAIHGSVSSDITITGDLTLKETTEPVTFSGTASLDDEMLSATMTGTVLMSTYGIGPIHVAGLAHTEDEVEFTLELSAAEIKPDSDALPSEQIEVQPVALEAPDGEFGSTIRPILESGCASCHVEGGAGHSTVQLDTAGDAAEIAQDIALVTGVGFMPPWPASTESLEFHDDYSLPQSDIDAIAEWAAAGGGLDIDASTPLEPDEPVFEPLERDQVIPARDGEYVGSLDKKDDYRCFIHEVEDPEGDGTWLSGIGYEPDELTVNHHSIIYLAPPEAREEAEALSGSDGKIGWECFGLSNMKTPGVRSIGGWAPGQQPARYREGVGIYIPPGSFIVNQIHFHFDHETPPDRSTLVLETISTEELAARDTPMTQITGNTYLTPAEGPCTPEEEGPMCDRDNVLRDIAQKYGGIAPGIPGALLRACGQTVDEVDDLDGTKFDSSCDLQAQNPGTLRSVLGHMHEFGDSYRMTLNPDTPEERVLLDIPEWSFEWQLYYVPVEEIRIDRDDTIRFECTWDRANAAMEEPRYITWNEGTGDEMCFSSVSVIPDTNVEGEPNNLFN